MKALLLSIKPKWVAKILNKEKTIEVRKKFPKNYKGWVYIYCTKDNKTKLLSNSFQYYVVGNKDYKDYLGNWNGKVVARFYCDKVEEIYGMYDELGWNYEFKNEEELLRKSCLDNEDLGTYLKICNNNDFQKVGYAIHISNIEIFDKPKELGEFYTGKLKVFDRTKQEKPTPILKICSNYCNPKNPVPTRCGCRERLTKAPQNYMFIEVEE